MTTFDTRETRLTSRTCWAVKWCGSDMFKHNTHVTWIREKDHGKTSAKNKSLFDDENVNLQEKLPHESNPSAGNATITVNCDTALTESSSAYEVSDDVQQRQNPTSDETNSTRA